MSRIIKLLHALKQKTDIDHPITQAELLEIVKGMYPEDDIYDRNTFSRDLYELAEMLNRDEEGNLQFEENWTVVFPGFASKYKNEICSKRRKKELQIPIKKLYYQHEVTSKELNALIQLIKNTHLLGKNEKEELEAKLIKLLASEYYRFDDKKLVKDMSLEDKVLIDKNLRVIHDAIYNKQMIEFDILKINEKGEAFTSDEPPYRVSPYDVVYHHGKHWLAANCQREYVYNNCIYNTYSNKVSVYRVDRIGNIRIARTPKKQFIWYPTYDKRGYEVPCYERESSGDRITKSRYVLNKQACLEQINTKVTYLHKEEVQLLDYEIDFLIHWKRFGVKERYDYSFIYDTFGNEYTVKMDEEDPYKTIVTVSCSINYFMEWVIQYADKVQIVGNKEGSMIVKDKLKQRINSMIEMQRE